MENGSLYVIKPLPYATRLRYTGLRGFWGTLEYHAMHRCALSISDFADSLSVRNLALSAEIRLNDCSQDLKEM